MLADPYYIQQPKYEEGIKTVPCSSISQTSPMTLNCTHKLRIIDIVYHTSNNALVCTKTLMNSCVMLTDSTSYFTAHVTLGKNRRYQGKGAT